MCEIRTDKPSLAVKILNTPRPILPSQKAWFEMTIDKIILEFSQPSSPRMF